MSNMTEEDRERKFYKAFAMMGADDDGTALAALRQSRSYLESHKLSFRDIAEQIQQSSGMGINDQQLADENKKLGRQWRDSMRENDLLRRKNDALAKDNATLHETLARNKQLEAENKALLEENNSLNLMKKFRNAGRLLVKGAKMPFILGASAVCAVGKIGSNLPRVAAGAGNVAKYSALTAGYIAWPAREAINGSAPMYSLACLTASTVAMGVVQAVRAKKGEKGETFGWHCVSIVGLAVSALMAGMGIQNASSLLDDMSQNHQVGQRTVVYTNRPYHAAAVATVVGREFHWAPPSMTEDGKTTTQKLTCIMYWAESKDIDWSQRDIPQQPLPMNTQRNPDRTSGTCP